jgi:phosphohistidine phosphatase
MTKRLLWMRHGKSDWPTPPIPDIERSLAKRGIKAAQRMGRFLREVSPPPDQILCSNAQRTRMTNTLVLKTSGFDSPVEYVDSLYEAAVQDCLTLLQGLPDSVQTVLMIGHEPTGSEFLATLVGGGQFRVPTAAIAQVALSLEHWSEVKPGCGELHWLVTPKLLLKS